MSEARTPEEDTITPGTDEEPEPQDYDGPDPEDDPKGDGAAEDQST